MERDMTVGTPLEDYPEFHKLALLDKFHNHYPLPHLLKFLRNIKGFDFLYNQFFLYHFAKFFLVFS